MKVTLFLASLMFASAAFATATFSGSSIQCDDVAWINLDGSYQCNNPLFYSTVTNGTTTLSVDAPVEGLATTAAVQAQGQGVCGYLGYADYVGQTTVDTSPVSNNNIGPFVSFDASGNVLSMDKTTKSILTSITCK